MTQVRNFIERYYSLILLMILACSFFARVYRLHIPENYYFDEVYHAVTAKLIAQNDPRAFEWWNPAPEKDTAVDWLHPPLAKYTQAISIQLFGPNSFGWRISSVIFGVLCIYLTAELARVVTKQKSTALVSAVLAASDGLLLTQSRIAMNDIHVTFWILLTLLVYVLSRRQSSSRLLFLSIALGSIALATKWSGLFVLILILCFEFYDVCIVIVSTYFSRQKYKYRVITSQALQYLGFLLVTAGIVTSVYLASYGLMFAQGKDLTHFQELHRQIFHYQLNLDATHPAQSRPWQWFLDLRPVWLWVEYPEIGIVKNIYAFGNPVLFWFGGGSVLYVSSRFLRKIVVSISRKNWESVSSWIQTEPLVLLTLAYWIVWLPWILSPRIMFFYHYTPAVPLLCIISATQLHRLQRHAPQLSIGVVVAVVACFIVWYPHWTGLPVSTEFAERVYFAIPSWRQQ